MSGDLELKTRLTADASGLSDALRNAERGTQNYVRGVEGAGAAIKTTATAEREAANAVTTATMARKAFLDGLREQVQLYGKSTEEVLRYRAAQAGVTDQAAPLIQQLQAQRQALQAAAEAAREEAAAQREAAAAKKTAEAAQQAFLTGLREQVDLQGKSNGDVLRYRAAQMGVGPEAEQYIVRYEQAMGKAGVTAGQTAAAMRMLPAQITDVTVSLAAGMPIWMVAMQQGGQIKDSFGGIGPTFTALRATISPVTLAVGGLAAVLGTLTLAWYQGLEQSRAFERAILMSGNAAGTTTSRLLTMSEGMARVMGTQRQASETLTQLVSTGQVANRNLEAFGLTAEAMERRVGIAVATTVKNFEDLGRAPTQKTIELNKQYGYLTLAVYEQIRALEKQGRVQQAGELAQKTYSEAQAARMKDLSKDLGSLERGWERIKDGAGQAWDAMLGLGRRKTTQQELDLVTAQLKALDDRKSNNPALTEQRKEVLRAKQAELQELLRFENRSAESQAREREAVNKTIENEKRVDEERSALVAAKVAGIKDKLSGLTGAYGDADRMLEQQHQAHLVDEQAYWETKRLLITKSAEAEVQALRDENTVLERQKLFGAERIQRDQQVASNTAEMARIRAKASTDVAITTAQETAAYVRLANAVREYGNQLSETQAARARQHQRELETLGRGDSARALAGRQNSIDDRYIQQRNQLDSERLQGSLTESEYQARLALLKGFYKQALEAEVAYQREVQQAQQDGSLGMQRALENYLDRARDVAGQTEQLFSNAFQSMEDAVVKFAMTGKVNFRSFAESVIADLIRIYVRQQMAGFISQAITAIAGAPSGGAEASFMSTMYHSGGVVGVDNGVRRMERTDAWASAPRYHTGLKSDEFRAILQKGESVLTPAQMRQLAPVGSAQPVLNIDMPVTVVNNTGTPVRATTQRSQDGNGWELILEAAEAQMAANVSQGVGPMAGALQGRYGLQPSMV